MKNRSKRNGKKSISSQRSPKRLRRRRKNGKSFNLEKLFVETKEKKRWKKKASSNPSSPTRARFFQLPPPTKSTTPSALKRPKTWYGGKSLRKMMKTEKKTSPSSMKLPSRTPVEEITETISFPKLDHADMKNDELPSTASNDHKEPEYTEETTTPTIEVSLLDIDDDSPSPRKRKLSKKELLTELEKNEGTITFQTQKADVQDGLISNDESRVGSEEKRSLYAEGKDDRFTSRNGSITEVSGCTQTEHGFFGIRIR